MPAANAAPVTDKAILGRLDECELRYGCGRQEELGMKRNEGRTVALVSHEKLSMITSCHTHHSP